MAVVSEKSNESSSSGMQTSKSLVSVKVTIKKIKNKKRFFYLFKEEEYLYL